MKSLPFAPLAALALLAGCSAPITGTVVAKDEDRSYVQRYTDTERYSCGSEPYTSWSGTGKNRKSTVKSRTKWCKREVPKTRTVPADYDITIRNADGDHEVDVNQITFHRIQIGQQVDTSKLP